MNSVGWYVCNWRYDLTFATASETRQMNVTVDVQVPDQAPHQV